MSRPWIKTLTRSCIFVAAYTATGILGLKLAATGGGYAAPIWLPTGIAIAVVILGGRKYLPAVWLGAFLTNFHIGEAFSFSNACLSAAIATGNMLEAFSAEFLLRHTFRFHPEFLKLSDVTSFVAIALLSPIVSATIGISAVTLSGKLSLQPAFAAWLTWWIGDALGALILSPILISFAQKSSNLPSRSLKRGQFAFPVALIILSLLAFGIGLPIQMRPLFIALLSYSVIIWCALALPIRRFFYVFGFVAVTMMVRAYLGQGLFGSGDIVQRLALLQFFLGSISVTMMILSAVVSERLSAVELSHEQELALMHSKKMSALGEMSSGIAHEISNPLLVIYGKTDQAIRLLESGRSNSENLLPILEKIDSMARRIDKIIKAVRFYSRKADADPFRAVPVRSIVDDTLELCKDYFRNNHVDLVVDPIPEELEIECQPVMIVQVLLNLLTNAQGAAREQDTKWVRLHAQRTGERWVEIAVTDSGSGIPAPMRSEIFKPFFTTKKAGEGTGLGLSVSWNIVESHGGSISLDATHPNTRFVICLPREQTKTIT